MPLLREGIAVILVNDKIVFKERKIQGFQPTKFYGIIQSGKAEKRRKKRKILEGVMVSFHES
ncbi:MAG: hypothetical protein ACTSWF_10230 [Candidatus Freyarchaeota archaeon]